MLTTWHEFEERCWSDKRHPHLDRPVLESPSTITDRTRHVILACSATKRGEADCAERLYRGVLWLDYARINKAGMLPGDVFMWALSARYGLLPTWRFIEPYDEKLTPETLPRMAEIVRQQWQHAIANATESVWMVGGDLYQQLATAAGIPVTNRVDGAGTDQKRGGIGTMRQRWRSLVEAIVYESKQPRRYPGVQLELGGRTMEAA